MNLIHLNLIFALCHAFLISDCASYLCCDKLNPSANSTDCKCSDQSGGVGTCICSSFPNTRQGWLCIKNSNGDSV